VPICILLAPEAASHEAKVGMMRRLSQHIDEAYPVTTTHIFVREASPGDVMLAGSLLSELASQDASARGARVCFLICPPGVEAAAKKTMMEKLTADILYAYPGSGDIFIIHREDGLANVMLNGRFQSETRSSCKPLRDDFYKGMTRRPTRPSRSKCRANV
jgi:hypothetical protein